MDRLAASIAATGGHMRVCVFGSGAIGSYLGVQLAGAGAEVSLVARGAHLEAMRHAGVRLLIGGEERVPHPFCTDDPEELEEQDGVIVSLKAHSLAGVVAAIR